MLLLLSPFLITPDAEAFLEFKKKILTLAEMASVAILLAPGFKISLAHHKCSSPSLITNWFYKAKLL